MMMPSQYQLLQQLEVGDDGARYLARSRRDEATVEVVLLTHPRSNRQWWSRLDKGLRLLRSIVSGVIRPVRSFDLGSEPPWIVFDKLDHTRLTERIGRGPMPIEALLPMARHLAEGLADAHRLGLVHGALCPSAVFLGPSPSEIPQVDLSGIQTRRPTALETTSLDMACRPPESFEMGVDQASDVFGLGAIMLSALTGRAALRVDLDTIDTIERGLRDLIAEMLDSHPEARPNASEVANWLRGSWSDDLATSDTLPKGPSDKAEPPLEVGPGLQIGRFRLIEQLGSGAMGTVFRAEDLGDGTMVALKLLAPEAVATKEVLQQFKKEARILSLVKSPFIANFIETNEERGLRYIATELVEGEDLESYLEAQSSLSEEEALSIMSDVTRALIDVHDRGILHRDIKPANILLSSASPDARRRVKLADFGIALERVPIEGELSEKGAIAGTPWYMAPEQCVGGELGPAVDVYAFGATLFHLLAGRPPFDDDSLRRLLTRQVHEAPPRLKSLAPAVRDETDAFVDSTLLKDPKARPSQATEILEDMEALLGRSTRSIADHPKLPEHQPGDLQEYRFEWNLASRPDQLWPLVANTERINEAAGLKPVTSTPLDHSQTTRDFRAESLVAGVKMIWHEHPFEWLENQHHSVLREFDKGLLYWYINKVELLEGPKGGTKLVHSVVLNPRNIIGKLVSKFEVGRKLQTQLAQVYRRFDDLLQQNETSRNEAVDFFHSSQGLGPRAEKRLEVGLDKLRDAGVDDVVAEKLGNHLRFMSQQDLARIRPIALARKVGVDQEAMIEACLQGTQVGLLELLWDLLCPVCRIPTQVSESLGVLQHQARCEACRLDFELDLDRAVELIFKVHPLIQSTDVKTYCVGSPGHSPHVVAQVHLDPGERILLKLGLKDGAYRLRSPQLAQHFDFHVERPGMASRLNISFSPEGGFAADLPTTLTPLQQGVLLHNTRTQPMLVRLERRAQGDDAVTASQAMVMPLFQYLFPDEMLPPELQLDTEATTLLLSEGSTGEGQAELVASCGGVVIKSLSDGVFAGFSHGRAAIQCAMELLKGNESQPHGSPGMRVALHRGRSTISTVDGRLEYGGAAVNLLGKLFDATQPGQMIWSRQLAESPELPPLCQSMGFHSKVIEFQTTEEEVSMWGVAWARKP